MMYYYVHVTSNVSAKENYSLVYTELEDGIVTTITLCANSYIYS